MRNFSDKGIILRKVSYKESSLILDILTENSGKITVTANSAKKPSSKLFGILDYLNEIECDLYKKEDRYTLKSAELINFNLYGIGYEKSQYLFAAAEILNQIIFHKEDSEKIYNLFISYLSFQKSIKKNHITIFWRFLLKLLDIIGVNLFVNHCAICKKETTRFFGYSSVSHGFVCFDCKKKIQKSSLIVISKETRDLLSKIYEIGNFLDSINISMETVLKLNTIFLEHLSANFGKPFHLKSLGMK